MRGAEILHSSPLMLSCFTFLKTRRPRHHGLMRVLTAESVSGLSSVADMDDTTLHLFSANLYTAKRYKCCQPTCASASLKKGS